ncbi:MAG: hypothetical protein R2705_22315 [Ilumatobacteraceae bacterium]
MFENGFPHRTFTGIRRDCPVAWHTPRDGAWHTPRDDDPGGVGFWSIASYGATVALLDAEGQRVDHDGQLAERLWSSITLELARSPIDVSGLDDDRAARVAAHEFARWCTPTASVSWTLRADYELGGHRISTGESVTCWLASANRDESVFGRTAMDLDLRRFPNPHLAWRDAPPDALADVTQRLVEFARSGDRFELVAEPTWIRSTSQTALLEAPVRRVGGR